MLLDTNSPQAWEHGAPCVLVYMGVIITAVHLSNPRVDVEKSINIVMRKFSIVVT